MNYCPRNPFLFYDLLKPLFALINLLVCLLGLLFMLNTFCFFKLSHELFMTTKSKFRDSVNCHFTAIQLVVVANTAA